MAVVKVDMEVLEPQKDVVEVTMEVSRGTCRGRAVQVAVGVSG